MVYLTLKKKALDLVILSLPLIAQLHDTTVGSRMKPSNSQFLTINITLLKNLVKEVLRVFTYVNLSKI